MTYTHNVIFMDVRVMDGANRFTRAVGASSGKEKDSGSYEAFEAFSANRRGARFDIVLDNGEMYLCSYSYLTGGAYHPEGFYTFNVGHNVIMVEGDGLEKLHQLLKEDRLSRINVFDPDRHEEPAQGQAKVNRVTIKQPFKDDPEGYDS